MKKVQLAKVMDRQNAASQKEPHLKLPCSYKIGSLVFEGEGRCLVEANPIGGGKKYIFVFAEGGACEFDIDRRGVVQLMDSDGVDFFWEVSGEVLIAPHRSRPGSRATWGRDWEKK